MYDCWVYALEKEGQLVRYEEGIVSCSCGSRAGETDDVESPNRGDSKLDQDTYIPVVPTTERRRRAGVLDRFERRIGGRRAAPIWLADALLIGARGVYKLPGVGES